MSVLLILYQHKQFNRLTSNVNNPPSGRLNVNILTLLNSTTMAQ